MFIRISRGCSYIPHTNLDEIEFDYDKICLSSM